MRFFLKIFIVVLLFAACNATQTTTSNNTTDSSSDAPAETPGNTTTEDVEEPPPPPPPIPTEEIEEPPPPPPPSRNNNISTSDENSLDAINKAIDAATYLTAEEKEMIREINKIRTNPSGYIAVLEEHIKRVQKGDFFVFTSEADEIATTKETIEELKKLAPLNPLLPHPKLQEVATKHGKDLQRTGKIMTPHTGSDGSSPHQRITKHSEFSMAGENYVGGRDNVRDSVLELLIDAGIDNRGHRKAILDKNWKHVACFKIGDIEASFGTQNDNWVQNFSD